MKIVGGKVQGLFGCIRLYSKTWSGLHRSFAPIARMETVRRVVSLVAQKRWTIYQLDVKPAFLHGELSEEVFVEQPPHYE